MLFVCCIFPNANKDDFGSRRGNMAWALAQWQHLVASREAIIALHQAMFIAMYRPSGMVIEIAIGFVTFAYIVDNSAARKKYFSLIFTI